MDKTNRVSIAKLQKLQKPQGKYSGAALKSAVYAAGASHREAKDLFSGANVWENFKLEIDNRNPKLQEQAKRKWKLAVDTATTIGLTVLRNNWNDRKDLNLGLSWEGPLKETYGSILSKKIFSDEETEGESPIREEVESVLRNIGREVHEDVLKKTLETAFVKSGRKLRPDWWKITKKNLIEWSKKR